MRNEVVYSLEVNNKGVHNSFDYDSMGKAMEAYKFLCQKFNNQMIVNKSKENYSDSIVQLCVLETYIGYVPSGVMASFVPEEWINADYEKVLSAAMIYHESNK
jgi:hypothetical protein